jgi:hypothetical protein
MIDGLENSILQEQLHHILAFTAVRDVLTKQFLPKGILYRHKDMLPIRSHAVEFSGG